MTDHRALAARLAEVERELEVQVECTKKARRESEAKLAACERKITVLLERPASVVAEDYKARAEAAEAKLAEVERDLADSDEQRQRQVAVLTRDFNEQYERAKEAEAKLAACEREKAQAEARVEELQSVLVLFAFAPISGVSRPEPGR